MSAVGEALEELLHIMKQLKMPAADNFLPGLSRVEIAQITQNLGLSLAPEVIELYECRNGVLSDGRYNRDVGIYYGYGMLPLHEAVEKYHWKSRRDEHVSSWFPILYADGDYFHLYCQAAINGEPSVAGAMLEFNPEIWYSSLSSMFRTFAGCYREGAFIVINGEIVNHDNLKVNQIGLRNNSNILFWQRRMTMSPS